ncbi:MAG: hypothetical protein MUF53_09900 [Gemmatimonadaceae bacterium]|nr:hypothetical protein [Gemmatimonadaceae bacterium]
MLAAWMLTYLVIGGLLLVVASAAERVAVWRGWPRRWVWAGAIAMMLVTPFVPRLSVNAAPPFVVVAGGAAAPEAASESTAPSAGRDGSASNGAEGGARARPHEDARSSARDVPSTSSPDAARAMRDAAHRVQITVARLPWPMLVVDPTSAVAKTTTPLLVLWGALSLTVLLLVVRAARRLRRATATWQPADAETRTRVAAEVGRVVPVWVSPDTGPAAFGLRRLQVVLPAWFHDLANDERRLLLAHEASHVRAGDPRVLAAALVALVGLPWHVPLLYAYRRLCRAVEHDCDARVLARHPDARQYGRLLVRTAEWLLAGRGVWRQGIAARWMLAPVPAFAAPATELERRVRALAAPVRTWRTGMAAGWRLAAGAVALLACWGVPQPTKGTVEVARPLTTAMDSLTAYRAMWRRGETWDGFRRRREAIVDSITMLAARRAVPDLDRRLAGPDTSILWLVLDANGAPVAHRFSERPHDFLWVADRANPMPDPPRPATAATPASERVLDLWSVARAFPHLDPRRVMEHGFVAPERVGGAVIVHAAHLYPGDSTQLDVTRARGDSVSVPSWLTQVARQNPDLTRPDTAYERALAFALREAVGTFLPEYALDGARGDPYVWVVFGPDGTPVARDTGRAGLGAFGRFENGGRTRARASATTADSLLSLDQDAFPAKFPELRTPPELFGWSKQQIGGRTLHVLYAFTDLSLARRSSRPASPSAPAPSRP